MKLLIRLGLILSLLINASLWLAEPAAAAGDNARWSPYNIPVEGESAGWFLASGSDVKKLALDNYGNLYACVTGLPNTLYKSTDGGYSWYAVGNITGDIVDIAIGDGDRRVIYCATASSVYKSLDDGESFIPLAAAPGGAGSGNIEITAFDVVKSGDNSYIAVATRDRDSGQYGGVYVLDDSQLFASWLDTGIKNFDVYDVAFSPNFTDDLQIVAVLTDEIDTFVTTRIGNAGWGATIGNVRLDKDNSGGSVEVTVSADIAFPDDYGADPAASNTHYVQYIAIDSGSGDGDVYIIYGRLSPDQSVATDLNAGAIRGWDNVDITSLQVTGEVSGARILAGAAASGCVYSSSDGGQSWQASQKEATGQWDTFVLMTDNFLVTGKAYAATSGSDSAISVTLDGGLTWK